KRGMRRSNRGRMASPLPLLPPTHSPTHPLTHSLAHPLPPVAGVFTTQPAAGRIPSRMKVQRVLRILSVLFAWLCLISCATHERRAQPTPTTAAANESDGPALAQVPTWSRADLDFFLHGSMSTEVVPEVVLRAFISTYPDLFPKDDLSNLGLIPDRAFGWP